jgi:hypothetical protein
VSTFDYLETAGNTALAPLRRPVAAPPAQPLRAAPRRHIEVAPTRAQRRARPRLLPAVVTIAGIGVILLAQLLLSIVLADGAYQISTLQTQQRDLLRDQQALSEKLEVLGSTQNLTANAAALGMVASGNPLFLNADTGAVSGSASASGATLASGANLVGNALLDGSTTIDPTAIAAAQAAENASADTTSPALEGTSTVPSTTTSPGTIPSPNTH